MLSDGQIAEMMRETWGCASIAPRHAMGFARAIEAEVRKQDDALIRQLVEALADIVEAGEEAWGKDRPCVRIGKKSNHRSPCKAGRKDMKVFLLRCNGALIEVFSTEDKALDYMRQHRKNSQFWRIEARNVL